jgi:hypothetical protein
MELVKLLCVEQESRDRAFKAAQRGLEYYIQALDYCWESAD